MIKLSTPLEVMQKQAGCANCKRGCDCLRLTVNPEIIQRVTLLGSCPDVRLKK